MTAPAISSDRRAASPRAVWTALVIVYVAWGSTYVAIRYMDQTVAPLLGAAIRFLIAGGGMYAYLWARGGSAPRVTPRELASAGIVGVLLLVGGNGLLSYAELHVPAGLAALVVASVPLWLLVIRIATRDRPPRATLTGLLVGFIGVALLVARGGSQVGVSAPHLLIVLAGSLSWALGSWASARLPMPADTATGTALEMMLGGVVLAVLGPLVGEHWGTVISHGSATSLLAIAYLVLIGSVLAFSAYVWLLKHAPISQVSTYAYVNPVVAVALGALLLGEQITTTTIVGGGIIVLAVALVIRAENRASVSARAQDQHPTSARAPGTDIDAGLIVELPPEPAPLSGR